MNRRSEVTLLAGVFVTGIATVILGTALPLLQQKYGVSEAQIGRLFAAQFSGSAVAASLSLRRPRFSVITGFPLIAIGLVASGITIWRYAFLSVLIYGVGLGLVLPSANMAIAVARQKTRGASLSILNLCWGLGAASTPLTLYAVRAGRSLASIYIFVAILSALVGIFLAISSEPYPELHADSAPGTHRFDRNLLLFAATFMLYIGAEGCVGGWTSAYLFKFFSAPRTATVAIAGFWSALLIARAVTPAILRRITESRMLWLSLLTTLAGVTLMLSAPFAFVAVLGAIISGAGMAAVFGLLVSTATFYAEGRGTKLPGWLFTCASIGGVSLPWLFGVVAQRTSLRIGFVLPFAAIITLLALTRRVSRTMNGVHPS